MKKTFVTLIIAFFAVSAFSQEVVYLNESTFKEKVWDFSKNSDFVFEGNKPVIIDFYADWCGPCKMLAPHLKEIQDEYGDKLQVYKVNVDNNKVITNKFNIRNIPTVLIVPSSGNFKQIVGYRSKEQLISIIKSNFNL